MVSTALSSAQARKVYISPVPSSLTSHRTKTLLNSTSTDQQPTLIAMDGVFDLETDHGWAFAQQYHTVMSAYAHDSVAVWYDILPLNGNTVLGRALECAKRSQDKRVLDDLFSLVAWFFKFSPQGDFLDFLYQVKQEENDAVSRIMPVLEACFPKHYNTIYANILPTPDNSIIFNG